MPQTATDDFTKVRLKDGTVLRLKGANLSPDDVSERISAYRASQGAAPDAPAPTPTAAATPADAPPDSVVGGFGRRLYDTVANALKGAYNVVGPPTNTAGKVAGPLLPAYRVARGLVESYGPQVMEGNREGSAQMKRGMELLKTDPAAGLLEIARSTVTGASEFNPFAAGTVNDVNRLKDQGRSREAVGTGAFDIMTLLAGGRKPEAMGARSRVANLTAMTGKTGETASSYAKVLPDLDDTIKEGVKQGIPSPTTPQEVLDVVNTTSKRLDGEFNKLLFPVRNQKVIPMEIANRIRSLITPNMPMTAEGRVERSEILKAATDYEKPWTYNQLNAQRMANNNRLDSFYKRDSQAQAASLSHTQVKIAKAVRDEAANIVYDAVDKFHTAQGTTGGVKVDTAAMKAKQGALWGIKDTLSDRVDKLADDEAENEGKTLRQKIRPSAYASTRNVHGYLGGLSEMIPGGGPSRQAAIQAKKAFRNPGGRPTAGAILRRRAILALPLSHFVPQGSSDAQ